MEVEVKYLFLDSKILYLELRCQSRGHKVLGTDPLHVSDVVGLNYFKGIGFFFPIFIVSTFLSQTRSKLLNIHYVFGMYQTGLYMIEGEGSVNSNVCNRITIDEGELGKYYINLSFTGDGKTSFLKHLNLSIKLRESLKRKESFALSQVP